MSKNVSPEPRRRRASKVVITHVTPIPHDTSDAPVAFPASLMPAYRQQGIMEWGTARDLYRARVHPDDIGNWTGAGIPIENYHRMVVLSSGGVKPSDIADYPPMRDEELSMLVRAGISADLAHEYGHALGWCCGKGPNRVTHRYYWHGASWGYVAGWVKYGAKPELIKSITKYATSVDAVSDCVVLRASPRLLEEMNSRELYREWKVWVEAAEGHVEVARAVCDAGGTPGTVKDWLLTGEPPERIVLLARSGVNPATLPTMPVGELTEEDLEVWALLTELAEENKQK